ncbi:hypothetical protein HNO88_000746 [Novosphingobium chloroacetimidivorans]|uniref:Uncharacterized protein n=1 Tax=Novosphingobium chloroacetimidivorans TaxID=1428314 RepID=A0A7W7K841_9SPHN|nr:hypothetical protein [Novosphingobium chloroacetimidivorans]
MTSSTARWSWAASTTSRTRKAARHAAWLHEKIAAPTEG